MPARNSQLNISIFQLQAFTAVYEAGQTSLAATNLSVTPSKVSRAVTQLQYLLDQPLLLRRQAGLEPSDFGHQFYPQAKQLLLLASRCEKYQPQQSSEIRHWRIACPLELCPSLQHHLLQDRDRQQAEVQIEVVATHQQLHSAFQQQQLQLAITSCSSLFHQYQQRHLSDVSQLYLLAHQHHPLWSEPLDWSRLAQHQWGLLMPEQSVTYERLGNFSQELGAKADYIADLQGLQYQLEQSGWIALLSTQEASNKMENSGSVRKLRLPASMLTQLNTQHGRPHLTLVISPQVCQYSQIPSWLLHSLKGFCSQQVNPTVEESCR